MQTPITTGYFVLAHCYTVADLGLEHFGATAPHENVCGASLV